MGGPVNVYTQKFNLRSDVKINAFDHAEAGMEPNLDHSRPIIA